MAIKVNPYLNLEGTTEEAVYFYAKVLGGQVLHMSRFGDMPADPNYPLPEGMSNRIMHAHLKVGDYDLMFSDTFPGMAHQPGDTVTLSVHPDNEARAREIFSALEDGGQVIMPLQQTDWSPLYGSVKDKFGVVFQVNVQGDQQ